MASHTDPVAPTLIALVGMAFAVVFLVGSIGIGMWITPEIVRRLARLEFENVKLPFGVAFAFFACLVG